jgi:hypothetical protein
MTTKQAEHTVAANKSKSCWIIQCGHDDSHTPHHQDVADDEPFPPAFLLLVIDAEFSRGLGNGLFK